MKSLFPGRVIGGMLLIAGSCIGVGMLVLPVLMGIAGLIPSMIMLVIIWGYMTFTGLLLVEINGWFKERVNIVSMSRKALGKFGGVASWFLYLFLFYSLLVAYLSGTGNLFTLIQPEVATFGLTKEMFQLFYVLLFGVIVYMGTRVVDVVNRYLMVGLIFSYFALIGLGLSKIDLHLYTYFMPKYSWIALPVLVTSFGFHNMIPSLTAYMNGDLKRMRITVIGGSILALIVYFLWILLFLGTVPAEGKMGLISGFEQKMGGIELFQYYVGQTWVKSFAKGFAFFAITTSFLAQSLGLMHFIADGMKVEPSRKRRWWLLLLTLVPPFILALYFPGIIFQALGFAGGICAVILFGFFPAITAWIGRYQKKITSSYRVGGGKGLLIVIIAISFVIVLCEISNIFFNSF